MMKRSMYSSGIDVGLNVDTVFYLASDTRYFYLNGGYCNGKKKAKYFYYGDPTGYTPYLDFSTHEVRNCIEAGIYN